MFWYQMLRKLENKTLINQEEENYSLQKEHSTLSQRRTLKENFQAFINEWETQIQGGYL